MFVSVDVGYSTGLLDVDGGDAMKQYKRCVSTLNAMFKQRDAEVRAAFGVK